MKYFLTLFLLTNTFFCFSQNIDSARIKVTYEFSFYNDSLKTKSQKDICVLAIGNSYSVYYSYLKYQRDSLIYNKLKNGGAVTNILNSLAAYKTNGSSTIIYKKQDSDSLIVLTELAGDKYLINDKVDFKWLIKPDTVSILNNICQKAIVYFRGREYTAWFSPAIPVNEGPWKFYGLPGLILKIQDENGYFNFECTGIEVLNSTKKKAIKNVVNNKYTTISLMKYNKLVDLYYDNPTNYLRNVKGMNFTIISGNENQVKRKRPLQIEKDN
ncbi:MAG: GLPGLI family protein [Chitinophagaceae bacterium]